MAHLCGEKLRQSNSIAQNISSLVEEVSQTGKALETVRPPQKELQDSAQKKMDEIGANRGRPLYFPYIGSGIGNGALVELEDGSVKLDLINGIGVNLLGHSHPEVIKASLRAALTDQVIQGNLQPGLEYYEMGKKLTELARKNSRLEFAWITTSGSMANEIALKISRQKNSPARKVIAMQDAFAGRTTMMTEIGDNPSHAVGQPEYGEVLRVPFYDEDDPQSSEKSLKIFKEHVEQNEGDISAFVFEPVQGEGGFRVAPREFFVPMLEICKEKGIAVWLDEVQTFCRTGEFFAYETLGIGEYVDILSLAKTAQVAATLYTRDYNPQPGLIAGTFAGSSVALAAGKAGLDVLSQGGFVGKGGRIEAIHAKFRSVFQALIDGSCKGHLDSVGGVGLMVAVTPFGGEKDKVFALVKRLYDNGLMSFACGHGPYRVRFLVPATMTDSQIELAGEIVEKSILEAK